ncbi:MAG TPA: hypothetical protein VM075_07000 [Anaerolineae bacterium]|nr:hypothetical protein [Anaerolineae bacterium]
MLAGLKRGHLLFVPVGIVVGLILGLLITWQVWPVEYYDTDPVDLRQEHKDDYVVMIAAAYAQDRDLGLASLRLGQLGLEDAKQSVLGLFQRYGEAGYTGETRSLARLAYDLGVTDVALLPYVQEPTPTPELIPTPEPTPTQQVIPTATETPAEPSPTPTQLPPEPTSTATQPLPTPTYTPTTPPEDTPTPTVATDFDYQLVEQSDLGCSSDRDGDYILVHVRDENDRGVAGVKIVVKGPGVEDWFFTGLKPEIGPGFADYLVTAPGSYTVQAAEGRSQVTQGLSFAADCPAETPHRSWRVVFRRVTRQ